MGLPAAGQACAGIKTLFALWRCITIFPPFPEKDGEMKTIMIVDDQPHVRQLVEIALRRDGWRVVAVESGEAAIALARVQPPDLIIMDIMMPGGMDGFQAIDALKGHPVTAACPVLVLTAKSQESERQRSLELGAAGYLAKPFKLATLIAQAEELLHGESSLS